jgi:uncharacterized membrane protein (DUF106 family)
MDTLWRIILQATHAVMNGLDTALAPVNALHPLLGILILAACTVLATHFLRKRIVTKRYLRLQEEFRHWYDVRQEALSTHSEPEKAKCLAQNIDKATLNKVYYDYFFEGLLLNLITTYLPVLCVAGYINEAYKPENLQAMLGQPYLFSLTDILGRNVTLSPLLLFVLSLILGYTAFALLRGRLLAGRRSPRTDSGQTPGSTANQGSIAPSINSCSS